MKKNLEFAWYENCEIGIEIHNIIQSDNNVLWNWQYST